MKLVLFLVAWLIVGAGFAGEADKQIPPLIGELPMSGGDGPVQFGARKDGIRIGLLSEKPAYRLNHRINVWCAFETERTLTEFGAVRDNFLFITHPDGTITKETGVWPCDGPPGASWGGGMSDLLHRVIRKPGSYKLQWKIGALESKVVTFTILPE
jgi:hypothetical protein